MTNAATINYELYDNQEKIFNTGRINFRGNNDSAKTDFGETRANSWFAAV